MNTKFNALVCLGSIHAISDVIYHANNILAMGAQYIIRCTCREIKAVIARVRVPCSSNIYRAKCRSTHKI